ncbi:MAG: UbiA family prenyltransferase [Limisphaerales bacterium]
MIALRTLLALIRASTLPAVWSNCLAGWWLSGAGPVTRLPLLFAGVTFLYLGGVFLNDALDARYDRQFRRVRPIPAGAVSEAAVLRWALAWLLLGEVCLFALGKATGGVGLALAFCAVVYNATHRLVTFSPVLLGLCRFLLYVTAATASAKGLEGWTIWCGIALALYVIGARCLPRPENILGHFDYWPVLLMGAPVLLALIMDAGPYRMPGLELSAVLLLWVVYCLRRAFWPVDRDFARAASGLMAGIVLVDWLAVADAPRALSLVFLGLFGATMLVERVAPG